MAALCDAITVRLDDMAQLFPDTPMGYALEPDEGSVVGDIVEMARKAGQVRGARLTWVHKGSWFVFRNTPLGMSVTRESTRPAWAVAPPKAKLVPIMVPEHLVESMRLHLGALVNA
jgi:hypothetical protein